MLFWNRDVQDLAEGAGNVAGGVIGGGLGSATKYAARELLFTPQNRFQPTRPLEMTARWLAGMPETTPDQAMEDSVRRAVLRSQLVRCAKAAAGLGAPVGFHSRNKGGVQQSHKSRFAIRRLTEVTLLLYPLHLWGFSCQKITGAKTQSRSVSRIAVTQSRPVPSSFDGM